MRITMIAAAALSLLAMGADGRSFDPKTVETLEGKVLRVEPIKGMRGTARGMHLVLKTDKEEISVHLGPEWYLERQEFEVKAGDQLAVVGSRASFAGKPALIASELRKGEAVLRLRDEQGYPAWAGWRRGGGPR